MKKTLTILVSLLGLGVLTVSAEDSDSRFQKGEWDISPFATYVNKSGGKWGVGSALTYFLTKQFGVGAATYWTDFGNGTFFNNLEAEGYFRITQFDRVAPYATASLGYQFDRSYWFQTFGGGVDFRMLKNLSAFSDLQFRIADNNNSQNGAFFRLGVRFSF